MTASRQTKLKVRKGFIAAPMHYNILMVHQFNDQDQKTISKGLIKALTPEKAKVLLPTSKDSLLPRDKRSKWSLIAHSSVGLSGTFDLYILRFKGLDVAVFFKRQTSVITPEPEDPAPEGYVQDEDDLWARLDLFSKSARQLVGSVRSELSNQDAEISRLTLENEAQTKVIEHDARTIHSLRNQLQAARSKSVRNSPTRKK